MKIEIAGAGSVETGLPDVGLDDSRPGRVDSRDFGRVFADEWEKCDNPGLMLRRICGRPVQSASSNIQNSLRPSDRKLRLWACSCVRAVWESVKDDRSRHAVELAEHYADGLAPWEEVKAAWPGIGFSPAYVCLWDNAAGLAEYVADTSIRGMINGWEKMPSPTAQADLMRDIFGNPFRPAIGRCDPEHFVGRRYETRCKTHVVNYVAFGDESTACPGGIAYFRVRTCTPQVMGLAAAAYNDRSCAWCAGGGSVLRRGGAVRCEACKGKGRHMDGRLDGSRLVVLADALDDAGCTDEAITGALRGPGPHYKGFWPLDMVLGKT